MPRPVTLFTGQWADLPLAELAPLAREMGYDGLELACWGDHFDVTARSSSRTTSPRSGRSSTSTASSATPSPITSSARPSATRSTSATRRSSRRRVGRRRPRGRPAAGRQRDGRARPRRRARSASTSSTASPARASGTRSTPSRRPPGLLERRLPATSPSAGRRSSTPSTTHDVSFALEVHPTEIAFDIASAERALEAVGGAQAVRLQLRPVAPRLSGRRLRQVHPPLRRPHLPRPHEGRVVGPRRRHRRRLRRPHELRRRPPLLGLPLARPRRRELRGNHRRAQRHRVRRPARASSGRTRDGPRARRAPSRRRS